MKINFSWLRTYSINDQCMWRFQFNIFINKVRSKTYTNIFKCTLILSRHIFFQKNSSERMSDGLVQYFQFILTWSNVITFRHDLLILLTLQTKLDSIARREILERSWFWLIDWSLSLPWLRTASFHPDTDHRQVHSSHTDSNCCPAPSLTSARPWVRCQVSGVRCL